MTAVEKNIPDLRFPEFEGNWESRRLDKVASVSRGRFSPRPRNDPKYYGGIIPFVQTQDIVGAKGIVCKHTQTLNDEGLKVSKLFPKGTVLITIAANIGYSGILAYDMACPDSLIGLQCSEIMSGEFLNYFLSTQQKYMEYIAPEGAQKNINVEFLSPYPIPFTIIKEQQKIADFLTVVDGKIGLLSKKKDLAERYKKGVMQKLFSQSLRFTNKDGTPYPDWEEKTLGDFLIPDFREVNKPTEKYLAIGIRSHCKGTFQKPGSDPNKIAMTTLFQVKENDLIVNITFAWEGAIAIVPKKDKGGHVSHRFPTYVFVREKVIHEYFRYIITQKFFRFTLNLISPGGAGRNRVLSKKEFLKIKWTLPTVEEQQKIADFLSSLDQKITHISNQLSQAQAFKKGLLQQMFV